MGVHIFHNGPLALAEIDPQGIRIWGYRGAYEEWPLHEGGDWVVVPFGASDMQEKILAINEHVSQLKPEFPSFDPREFFERARDRNRDTGALLEQLGYVSGGPWYAEVFRAFTLDQFLGRKPAPAQRSEMRAPETFETEPGLELEEVSRGVRFVVDVLREGPDADPATQVAAARRTDEMLNDQGVSIDLFVAQFRSAVYSVLPARPQGALMSQDFMDRQFEQLFDFLRDYLKQNPDKLYHLALQMPDLKNDTADEEQVRSYLPAIKEIRNYLKFLSLQGKISGKSGLSMVQSLRELKIPYGPVRNLETLKPEEQGVVPTITSSDQTYEGKNQSLLFVGLRTDKDIEDPRIAVYAAAVQFVFAIVAAGEIKNPQDFKDNPKAVQADLLKAMSLFRQTGDKYQVIQFISGTQAVVSLGAIEAYLEQVYQAQAQIEQAA